MEVDPPQQFSPGSRAEFEYVRYIASRILDAAVGDDESEEGRALSEDARHLLDMIPDAAMIIRARGEILMVNPSFQKLLKTDDSSQAVGKDLTDFLSPEDHARAVYDVLRAGRSRTVSGCQYAFVRTDGSRFTADVSMSSTSVEGSEVKGVLVCIRDISENTRVLSGILRDTEEDMRFMAKRFRTDLIPQLKSLSLLMKLFMKDMTEKNPGHLAMRGKEIAETLEQSIVRTEEMAGILCAAKLLSDGLPGGLLELAGLTQERSGVSCAFLCDGGIPPLSDETATHLYRICLEAVTNAVQHGKAKSIWIELGMQGTTMTLIVKDDGQGIPDVLDDMDCVGIDVMRMRARLVGASFHLGKHEDGGTAAVCSLSLA